MPTGIWFKQPIDFFRFSKLFEIYPSEDLDLDERLNAYVRLSLYAAILHYAIFQDVKIFSVVVIVMILTYVYYVSVKENYMQYNTLKDRRGKTKEHFNGNVSCQYPKDSNPFMNVLINEYVENPERKEACDVDNVRVKDMINDKYYSDTYRDIGDVFDRKSSFRNFYTMPNTTIPNNQEDYAQWLYGIKEKTQKEGNGDRNKLFAKYY
jgi:hypothetical protein